MGFFYCLTNLTEAVNRPDKLPQQHRTAPRNG
jgi:hypothetical protein